VGADAVLCLAFPLVPPTGRRLSRLPELEAVEAPVLVVQGSNDRFGLPPADPPRRVVAEVPGDHALRTGTAAIGALVAGWLTDRVAAAAR
jgi:predicted alpha/beta-hydrolase family hydrolase